MDGAAGTFFNHMSEMPNSATRSYVERWATTWCPLAARTHAVGLWPTLRAEFDADGDGVEEACVLQRLSGGGGIGWPSEDARGRRLRHASFAHHLVSAHGCHGVKGRGECWSNLRHHIRRDWRA